MHRTLQMPLRFLAACCLLLLCLTLTGCQTLADAANTAGQMAATTATLQAYYDALRTLVDRNMEAQVAFGTVTGVPLDSDTRQQLEDIRGSLRRRDDMAASLARLAGGFADTVKGDACSDLGKQIADFNNRVVALTPLPSALSTVEVGAVKAAANGIRTACQAKQDVKAAKALVDVTGSVSTLFDKEADAYVSFSDSYYTAAAATSNALIQKQEVPASVLFQSSLEPFGLSADITDPDTRQRAVGNLKDLVAARLADRKAKTRAATDDLSDALHVMHTRSAALAARKPLHADRPPFTLDGVRQWIEQLRHDLGDA